MCELGNALVETGYVPFIAAGMALDANEMPILRLAADARIVRRMADDSWLIVRATLIAAIDKMRTAPLDDLTRA